jgi:hypothetical protein
MGVGSVYGGWVLGMGGGFWGSGNRSGSDTGTGYGSGSGSGKSRSWSIRNGMRRRKIELNLESSCALPNYIGSGHVAPWL